MALAGLAYYTMTLQTQLAILRVNLEPGKQKIFGITYQLLFEKYLCWQCILRFSLFYTSGDDIIMYLWFTKNV